MSVKMRKSLIRFAENVETTLRKNDHKSGWKHETDSYLDSKLVEEVCEYLLITHNPMGIIQSVAGYLSKASHEGLDKIPREKRTEEKSKEILDVGAVAMMIFDNANDNIIPKGDEDEYV